MSFLRKAVWARRALVLARRFDHSRGLGMRWPRGGEEQPPRLRGLEALEGVVRYQLTAASRPTDINGQAPRLS